MNLKIKISSQTCCKVLRVNLLWVCESPLVWPTGWKKLRYHLYCILFYFEKRQGKNDLCNLTDRPKKFDHQKNCISFSMCQFLLLHYTYKCCRLSYNFYKIHFYRSFQNHYGLIPTGKLNKRTIRIMKIPRCGISDINKTRQTRSTKGMCKWVYTSTQIIHRFKD